jgi:hypothetical protein
MALRFRLQFRLRTLLVAAIFLPPMLAIVLRYPGWRDDRLWHALESAKQEREASLLDWRDVYERHQAGQVGSSHELAAQRRYFAARGNVESAVQAIQARYGNSQEELTKAMQARPRKK